MGEPVMEFMATWLTILIVGAVAVLVTEED